MNRRRQALKLCPDAAVVVVVEVVNELLLEVLHGMEFLQIEQFTFEKAEEVFCHCVVQTVALPSHALPDALAFQHPLILLVLVLPSLVRVENQSCSIRNRLKGLGEHRRHQAQDRLLGEDVADQIAVV